MDRREFLKALSAGVAVYPVAVSAGDASPWKALLSGYSGIMKFGAQYGSGQDPDTNKLIEPASAMGLKIWRSADIDWSRIEKTPGVYTFAHPQLSNLDKVIKAGRAVGMEPLLTLSNFSSNPLHPAEASFSPIAPFTDPPTHVQAAYKFAVTHIGTACNKYELMNEPDLRGQTPDQALQVCENLYSQIKVGNPNADVFAYGGGEPFHYSDFANGFVTRTSPFGGHKWTEITDGISFHEYGTVGSGGPAAKGESKPEYLFMRAKGGMDIFRASRPNCRFWLTESSWNAAGDSISYPQTTVAQYLGRYCFLLRTLPGLEIFSYYQLIDVDPNGWGLHVNKATPKLQAAAYKDALSVLHHVTNASLYQHATAPVQVVAMRMDDGTNRVCVWGNDWKWQSGYQGAKTSKDQSGIVPMTITSAAKGTLSMKAIGGATTTHPVDPGTHEIPVSYNPTATVLSADVAITFEGLPPA